MRSRRWMAARAVPRPPIVRAAAAAGWTARNWRRATLFVHLLALTFFGLLAVLGWMARPGGLANFVFGVGVFFALALALRLPWTLRLVSRPTGHVRRAGSVYERRSSGVPRRPRLR